jgi:Holliday junction DNA helicase RuvA
VIGRIKGTLAKSGTTEVEVEVNGLTYEIQVPLTTACDLPGVGESVVLHTHFVVSEDAHQLYGFTHLKAKQMFRALIKVNGIGPKMALGVVSSAEPQDLLVMIRDNDLVSLMKLPGIGKKTAERLAIDLRDRFKEWSSESRQSTNDGSASLGNSFEKEAEAALVGLGYKAPEASKAISLVSETHQAKDSGELILKALKILGSGF